MLYVPRGALHATSTLGKRGAEGDRSAHLTAGVDSYHSLCNAGVLLGTRVRVSPGALCSPPLRA